MSAVDVCGELPRFNLIVTIMLQGIMGKPTVFLYGCDEFLQQPHFDAFFDHTHLLYLVHSTPVLTAVPSRW